MKVHIAYDGSECSDAAIDDLARAGLPKGVEITVLSVAEAWPQLPESAYEPANSPSAPNESPMVRKAKQLASLAMEEARQLSQRAATRIRSLLPEAIVSTQTKGGSPAAAILQMDEESPADLIVLGSNGRSALGRAALGSVSMSVLHHAQSSVRIARPRGSHAHELRLIVGIDGSDGAALAVTAIKDRFWPAATTVEVVSVLPESILNLPGADEFLIAPPGINSDNDAEKGVIHVVKEVALDLMRSGLTATPCVQYGDPKRLLLQRADDLSADCIFVGARGLTRMERLLLGSVSSGTAARARCSVEVVRWPNAS